MNCADRNGARRAEQLWSRLVDLPATREYRSAFETATGLALRFLPAQGLEELERVSGPFCAMIGASGMTPIGCPRKARLVRREPGAHGGVTCVCCVADVTEVVVPVFIGEAHAGNLAVGPFCLRRPTARDFKEMQRLLWRRDPARTPGRVAQLRADLEKLPVITQEKYRAAASLAGLLAQHLSESGNRLLLAAAAQASPLLQKIRRCFQQQGTEAIPLRQLARQIGLSATQLCRQFKKETGMTLSQYRLRGRIERAKTLLLNRQARVCDAAFAAGFGSIPHFNRAFRRLVGCAPSQFRRQTVVADQARQMAVHTYAPGNPG